MADIQLKTDRIEIEKLRKLFGEFYDEDSKKKIVYKVPDPEYPTVEKFVDHLYEIGMPKGTSVRRMELILEQNYENLTKAPEYSEATMSGAPEYPVSQTTLTSDQLEQFGEKAETHDEQARQTRVNSKEAVQTALDKKMELAQKAREAQQTLFVKTQKEEAKLTEKEQEKVEILKQQVSANPIKAVEDISTEIKSRVSPDIPDSAITLTAIGIVNNIQTNYVTVTETSVAQKLKAKPEFSWTIDYADQSKSLVEMQQIIAKSAFGEEIQKELVPNVEVEVSDFEGDGFTPMPAAFLSEKTLEVLKNQKEALDLENPNLQSFVEKELAKISSGKTQGSVAYDQVSVQTSLQSFDKGPEINWGQVGGDSKLNIAGGLLKGVVKNAATKVAGKIAVKTGLSEAAATAGTALGPLGTVAGWIAGSFLGKLLDSINWKELRNWSAGLLGGIAFLTTLPFVGLGSALGIGAGTTAVSIGLGGGLGGLTLGTIGAGIGAVFGAIATATIGAIAGPILFVLLGFPVIVALILFIINSGAYVVPPGSPTSGFSGSGINIVCSDEKGPVGVPGPSSTSKIANRAWEITSDLYQGFWCYWNRSPVAPKKYFPNDTLKYPRGYPDSFGYEQYLKNPNPQDENGLNMFWCTYLVFNAYNEMGFPIPKDGAATTMYNNFVARGKSIPPEKANPNNIVPGSAIFFHVSSGHSGINHVGIVYSVDPGGLVFVQSNGPLKSQSINFGGGKFGNLKVGTVTIEIKGFGLP
ncbi:MAG TPA: CHAP domain-containing protein [Patescibacteria group bacterium]|nr:CHAP domain-containing protein [Patescibacteria group bacterium]